MTPPYSTSPKMLNQVASISEQLGKLAITIEKRSNLRLRRIDLVRTIHGTLAMRDKEINETQINAVLNNKKEQLNETEIFAVENAIQTYQNLPHFNAENEQDLLSAHQSFMHNLVDSAGFYKTDEVITGNNRHLIHMDLSANLIPNAMDELFIWLKQANEHPLVKSAVFHYEFKFIYPFAEGNGRIARLWQKIILSKWHPIFAFLPIEHLIYQHKSAYYEAINLSTAEEDSRHFIEFMLSMVELLLNEVAIYPTSYPENTSSTHKNIQNQAQRVILQVTPQVKAVMDTLEGEMTREALQEACELKDRKSFMNRYLKPALSQGLIEMTIPDKPRSRLQRYRFTSLGHEFKNA